MQPFESALYVAPLPRNWEKALGYSPAIPRRWLIAYWTPFGDEAMYEDGIMTATCNWQPYLDIVQRGPLHLILRQLVRQHFGAQWASDMLGGSEREGTHCLLCDLHDREIYIAPLDSARTFILPPLPENYVPPTPEAQAALWAEVQANFEARWHAEAEAHQGKRMEICFVCVGGYVLATDWGYEVCPACKGIHVRWIAVQEGEVPTIEIWQEVPVPDDFWADTPPASEA